MSENNKEILRITRSKEDAKASYNKMSKLYDTLVGRSEKRFRDAGLQKLCAKDGEIILEIGFGTGHCTLALAQAVGNSGKVYGMDISEGMINITQSRLREAGLPERVDLKCGDASNLPYTANFFDAIFISFTLELFDTPEIPTILQQCQRVLKKDGRICVVAMSKEGKSGIMLKLYEWGHRKFPNYIDCRPIFVKKSIENVGFKIDDISKMPFWGIPVEIVVAKKT